MRETMLLQVAVGLACLVPLSAGLAGVLLGIGMVGQVPAEAVSMDSHWRYLSGLLLGIGVAFGAMIPRIEAMAAPFRLLTGLVVLGGLARLGALAAVGRPEAAMLFGLVMELGVTPALCLWQGRVAARAPGGA